MFNVFGSNKPSKAMQAAFLNEANKCVKVFLYANKHNAFPPIDGQDNFTLDLPENRVLIADDIKNLVQKYSLNESLEANTDEFNRRVQRLAVDYQEHVTDSIDAAVVVIVTLPIIEMLSQHYYKQFPSFRPMLEALDSIAKVCMPILFDLFDGDMPVEIRQAFPYSSQMFESYRSNG